MIHRDSRPGPRHVFSRRLARLLLPVLGGLGLLLVACDDDGFGPGDDVTLSEPFDFQGDASAFTRLSVVNVNGVIEIVGTTDDGTYRVTGVRRVRNCARSLAEDRFDALDVGVSGAGATLAVEADFPPTTIPCDVGVDFAITVPRGLVVEVTHVNGAITITDFQNGVSVVSVNGQVILDGIEDDTFVRLVNGAIDADVEINGDEEIDLLTVNGAIDLVIPVDTNAQLSATHVTGATTVTNLSLTNQVVTQTSLTGTLGSGEGVILLQTTNGAITITGR